MHHTIRWGHPGTTQWGTAIVETGTDWDGAFAADDAWEDGGTVVIFAGSAFRGSYVDPRGSASSFYRIRFTDGTAYSDWSDPIYAQAPRAFCGYRDLLDRCAEIPDWLPDSPTGTEYERIYRTLGEVTRAIESELDPIFPVPVQPGTDYRYDEPLVDSCAYRAIYRLALRHYSGRELPEMFLTMEEMAQRRIDNLTAGKESLRYLATPDEIGFTRPLANSTNQGNGETEIAARSQFTGERRVPFKLEIQTSGAWHSATFRFSEDNGATWYQDGLDCGSEYQALGNYGVPVRFMASHDEGQYDFVEGDSWTWWGYPSTEAGGPGQVTVRRLIRG